MPPKRRYVHTKSRDHDSNDDEPKTTKLTKTSSSTVTPSGKKLVDSEGNPYWELSGNLRRVTVSEFKGKSLISIREHYEKDGKVLPGRKGISLTVDQFNTLLSVLPQLDAYLADQDIELTRPVYGGLASTKGGKQRKEEEEPENNEEEMEEEEHEEGEKEEKEEVKPKKKPVKATPKKTESRKRKAKSERVDMNDDE